MIIQYKILWVDDQINSDDAMVYLTLDIKKYLKGLGFNPVINEYKEASEALNSLNIEPTEYYDLILSDFHLGHNGNGDSLIKQIRNNRIYTEILFYSGQQGFEETAKNLYTDRLSFFNLSVDEGYKLFTKKITNLIDLTVKKSQEIDNLRGLIIGAVSEMDVVIEEKLQEILNSRNEAIKGCIKEYAFDKISKRGKDINKNIGQINQENVNEHLNNPNLFDASSRAMILNKYIKEKKSQNKFKGNCENFYENYKKNALDVRNKLAHCKKSTTQNNTIVGTDASQEIFGSQKCIKHRIAINGLFELIQSITIE